MTGELQLSEGGLNDYSRISKVSITQIERANKEFESNLVIINNYKSLTLYGHISSLNGLNNTI